MPDPTTYSPNLAVDAFVAAAAARQPIPGGGAVTALVGALASSMGEMVLHYTVGKPAVASIEPQLREWLDQLGRARHLFLQLLVEDQEAFSALTAAGKLAAGDPERPARHAAALLASIRVPQSIAAAALAVLKIADEIVETANIRLLSDLAVSADLAVATVRCAVHNIRANLPLVTDPAERASLDSVASQILGRARTVVCAFEPKYHRRIAGGG